MNETSPSRVVSADVRGSLNRIARACHASLTSAGVFRSEFRGSRFFLQLHWDSRLRRDLFLGGRSRRRFLGRGRSLKNLVPARDEFLIRAGVDGVASHGQPLRSAEFDVMRVRRSAESS